jgi:hypothetical protein
MYNCTDLVIIDYYSGWDKTVHSTYVRTERIREVAGKVFGLQSICEFTF